MITESDVAGVRRLYEAVAVGDLKTIEACFDPEAVWRLPGRHALAGVYRGWPAIRDELLARQGPLSAGTFRSRLVDLAVGDAHIVAIVHATAEHAGRQLDQSVCQLIRMRDGRIAEIDGHYGNPAQLDAFWIESAPAS